MGGKEEKQNKKNKGIMIKSIKVNGRACRPNYGKDLSFETKRQEGERYYRTKMNGKLVFLDGHGDYSWIKEHSFETLFRVEIETDALTWRGRFTMADCEFNDDDRTCSVAPETDDIYSRFIEKMEEDFDVVRLAPVIQGVKMSKRPIVQFYTVSGAEDSVYPGVGDKRVTNMLGGLVWERDVTADVSSISMKELKSRFKFAPAKSVSRYSVNFPEESGYAMLNGIYAAEVPVSEHVVGIGEPFVHQGNGYNLVFLVEYIDENTTDYPYKTTIGIQDASTGNWIVEEHRYHTSNPILRITDRNRQLKGHAMPGVRTDIYMRILTDEYRKQGQPDSDHGAVYDVPLNDMTPNNLNYRYVLFRSYPNWIEIYWKTSLAPTEWGKASDGRYFLKPPITSLYTHVPIGRSMWEMFSIWSKTAYGTGLSSDYERIEKGRVKTYILKDAYPIWSVIDVLLKKMVPEPVHGVQITHSGHEAYSSFLYGSVRKPFFRSGTRLYISPASNVKKTYYKNPALKGSLSMKDILDFLRKVYHVYWFIDEDGRLRFEHAIWFMRGGDYYGSSGNVAKDLNKMRAPRHFKNWSFGMNSWDYEKNELPETVEFKWNGKATDPFNGYKLEHISNYIQKGRRESVQISRFNTDVDYIISCPDSVSDDGWVALEAEMTSPVYPDTFSVKFAHDQPSGLYMGDVVMRILSRPPSGVIKFKLLSDADCRAEIKIYRPKYSSSFIHDLKKGLNIVHIEVSPQDIGSDIAINKYSDGEPLVVVSVYGSDSGEAAPYVPIVEDTPTDLDIDGIRMQNGLLSMLHAVRKYHIYDMPGKYSTYNGYPLNALFTKRIMRQKVMFPLSGPIDAFGLIRTGLSSKISIHSGAEIIKLTYYPESDYADAEILHPSE